MSNHLSLTIRKNTDDATGREIVLTNELQPRSKSPDRAEITPYVNADNKARYSVAIVGRGMVPTANEGRIVGDFATPQEAQTAARNYNNS